MMSRVLCAALLTWSTPVLAAEGAPHHLIYCTDGSSRTSRTRVPSIPGTGTDELDQILDAFRKRGFVVSGEIRPKALRPQRGVRSAGGAGQAAPRFGRARRPHHRRGGVDGRLHLAPGLRTLQQPEVRFAFLGACRKESFRDVLAEEGKGLRGRLLFIREASDELSAECEPVKSDADAEVPPFTREIVINTGLSHGFLYRPLPEWVDPVVEWALR